MPVDNEAIKPLRTPLRWHTRKRLFGTPVDSLQMQEAIAFVDEMIAHGGWHMIVATNANKLWQAHRDARLAAILERAALVIPEWAAVWAAARLQTPVLGFIAGISLMRNLLPEAEHRGWRVFFLGARDAVIDRLIAKVSVDYPKLIIAGHHHGYFADEDSAAVTTAIRESRADLLFVAMGSPKQEYWLDEHGPLSDVKVALGVGGSFDVIAGLKKDTPDWARGRGLEWLYRLWLDPRNLWKRYLITNTWLLKSVIRERIAMAKRRDVFTSGPND